MSRARENSRAFVFLHSGDGQLWYPGRGGNHVNRLAIVVPLEPGSRARVAELLSERPPFDLAEAAFDRHSVYLSEEG
jgi:hypothetical protein